VTYPALIDRRMPYHRDGTRVASTATGLPQSYGPSTYPSGAELIALNSAAVLTASTYAPWAGLGQDQSFALWWFFPEQRELTGMFVGYGSGGGTNPGGALLEGSNDSTNGLDGTWETPSYTDLFPSAPGTATQVDSWRTGVKSISFTGGKRLIRIKGTVPQAGGGTFFSGTVVHLYGEKTAGQTPDDIIYIDHDTTPGVEFATPEDFGDRPLASTLIRQFRLKNTSATKTANTINIQCNDADFAISENGTTWVTTINISSLAAGAESATFYTRNTTPAVGSALGPRFAEIVTLVASWT
jgi:hypothetical protein